MSHIQGSIPTPLAGPALEADKVPGVIVTFDLETSLSCELAAICGNVTIATIMTTFFL